MTERRRRTMGERGALPDPIRNIKYGLDREPSRPTDVLEPESESGFYTVEFEVDVESNLASTPREAALIAFNLFMQGLIDCKVTDPRLGSTTSRSSLRLRPIRRPGWRLRLRVPRNPRLHADFHFLDSATAAGRLSIVSHHRRRRRPATSLL
jgi:hypothetical protein